ncbi:MAG: LPS-assembly protein LptD [Desulfobacteraceae bacterium]|nr:LPS-assembly protein LptD [Desulfobacteraceae bacterium]
MKQFLFYILFISIFLVEYASAGTDNPLFQDDPDEPWRISADELEYKYKKGMYIGKGNANVSKGNKKLFADYVRFDHKAMKVFAKGHVLMTAGEDVLAGTAMEINLDTQTGTIYNGSVFIKENHFYIKGDKIQKTGKYAYAAHNASISTCDGDKPAWKITGKNVKVTIEGYGFVSHAALWAKDLPVAYTPFLVFPVKLKRQTGLLPPRFGYSDNNGPEIDLPFYWAINENSDATFYEHYLGKRGNKFGLEYRYVFDEQSKGTLMLDYINDRKASELGISDADRYWFRMKHNQSMPFDFFAKIDIDIVSDQSYLHDFKNGYTGFDKTQEYFNENFGRELDDYTETTRLNSAVVSRTWPVSGINAGLSWYDNIVDDNQLKDTTLHKLPFLKYNSIKQPIAGALPAALPVYWTFDSEYTHFFREQGTKAHRMDLYPRIYVPRKIKNCLNLEASLGFRETAWLADYEAGEQTADPENNKTLHREMYDIKMDMSSDIFKIYRQNTGQVKHTIRPQITYSYIPGPDQDEYPLFDSSDRIEEKNEITYSIVNILTAKSENSTNNMGQRLCRFKLEQSYYINEAVEENETHRFSPVYGELEITPGRLLSLQADAEWSPYESRFQSHDASVSIWDERGDRIYMEYRYTRDEIESVFADIVVRLSDRVSVYTDYERSLREKKDIRVSMGFLYGAQCWSADFSYTDEDDDRKYAFMVNLFGLGELGSKQ